MASGAKKFKFISPGVFINEIDRSQIPSEPTAIGPVIIGRTVKGPGLTPTKVSSFAEFVSLFGAPDPGTGAGDNWRKGEFDGPTYAAYAAQAWLASGQAPATVVRLLGAEHRDYETAGRAGWQAGGQRTADQGSPLPNISSNGGAYGLLLINSASTLALQAAETGSLAAVWYLNKSGSIRISGTIRNDENNPITGAASALFESSGADSEFTCEIYNTETFDAAAPKTKVTFNFNPNSERYIRKVFNTNPAQTNDALVGSTSTSYHNYWLGETFDQFTRQKVTGGSGGVFGAIVALATGSSTWDDHRENFANAQSPIFHSQDLGTAGNFDLNNSQKLFKLVSRNHGEWIQRNIKISIENLRAAEYPEIDPYGSFSVVLRHVRDTDNAPQYLERFDNLSLNPNSENYIARRIGNQYEEWDDTQRRLRLYGDYGNQSSYVYVDVENDVEAGGVDPTALPFGYFGPPRPNSFTVRSGSAIPLVLGDVLDPACGNLANTFVTASSHIPFSPTQHVVTRQFIITDSGSVPFAFTGSFEFPAIRLRVSASDGGLSDPTDAYFGIQTTKNANSLVYDDSYVDFTRRLTKDLTAFTVSAPGRGVLTEHSFAFTLDDIRSGSGAGQGYYHSSGSRKAGTSYTAAGTNTYKALLDQGYNKFTAPMYGGFDGLDITEKEPFRNTRLDAAGATEFNLYTQNTIKRAIDTVKDPEFVEANLMSVPGVTNSTLTEHLISTCEERGDALAVIDLPFSYTPSTEGTSYLTPTQRRPDISASIGNLRGRSINSSYGCAFFPYVQIRDTGTGRLVDVPPSVVALGTFGSSQASTELWFAPAGFVRGGLSQGAAGVPVTGVKMRLTSKQRDDLYAANINPIASFPNEGIVIFGQKTLQVTRSALDRINVRRLMIFVKKEISRIANSILFEPNVQATWDRFTGAANPFLADVKARFGLTDFRVVLDRSTTTDDLVDRNILYAKIFLKPARSIEFIALDFIITRTGASFDD